MEDDAYTQISETDEMFFRILANSENVEFEKIPRRSEPPRIEDITEDHGSSSEQKVYSSSTPYNTSLRSHEERHVMPPIQEDVYASPPIVQETVNRAETCAALPPSAENESFETLRRPTFHQEMNESVPRDSFTNFVPVQPEIPPSMPEIPPSMPEIPPSMPEIPPSMPEIPPSMPDVPPRVASPVPVDDELAKQQVLMDLNQLQLQGARLSRQWVMTDRLDDMTLEMRRLTLAMDETANVSMLRDSMRLAITGIEMVNNRIGLLDLEGWSGEVCHDLNKHDANLSRIYRKYWKRSQSTSPETDIALSIIGSMGMYHMKRKMSQQLMGGGGGGANIGSAFSAFGNAFQGGGSASTGGGRSAPRARQPPLHPDSSDEEEPPDM